MANAKPFLNPASCNWLTRWTALACAVAAGFALGCSGQNVKDPDHDEKKEKARPFSSEPQTKDRLNEGIGDKEDWRYWEADFTGKAELRVDVSKWEDSTSLNAQVTLYDQKGNKLVDKPMSQANPEIKEAFEVEMGMKYFVQFRLNSGKGE